MCIYCVRVLAKKGGIVLVGPKKVGDLKRKIHHFGATPLWVSYFTTNTPRLSNNGTPDGGWPGMASVLIVQFVSYGLFGSSSLF